MDLVADAVGKRFGNFVALENVSFKLHGTGCFGYLGPNGAGKTTTMKLFSSLLRPNSGTATVNGIDVAKEPTRALRSIGALIEDPEPYAFMSVKDFINFSAKIRGKPLPDIGQLHALLDLPPLDRKCSALSKGQKRRVLIATLLAQDPEILLLDEPSAGLDPAEAVVFRNLILKLKADKMIFLSSHLLYEVTQVCDYALFINKGKLVEQGRVEDITKRFSSKAIRVEFLSEVPEAKLKALVDQKLALSYTKEGSLAYILNFDGRDDTRKRMLDQLFPLGIKNVQDAQLGLEQAYMDLMK